MASAEVHLTWLLCPAQSDDNEPSGEEELSGSGLDPRVCVFWFFLLFVVLLRRLQILALTGCACLLCLQTVGHLSSR